MCIIRTFLHRIQVLRIGVRTIHQNMKFQPRIDRNATAKRKQMKPEVQSYTKKKVQKRLKASLFVVMHMILSSNHAEMSLKHVLKT